MNEPAPPGTTVKPAKTMLARIRATPRWAAIAGAMLMVVALWYGVGGSLLAGVSPDPNLRPTAEQLPAGGSAAVGYAARLVDAEVNDAAFTPNDPFFAPTALARRTPAYQANVITTTAAIIGILAEAPDAPELAAASALLSTPVDQWWVHAGWPPIRASADRNYARAVASLVAHNQTLANSATTVTDPALSDRTRAALNALADLAEAQARAGQADRQAGGNIPVPVQLAASRGTAHAAAMLLRGLRDDNAPAVRRSGKAARWGEALDALDAAAATGPLVAREADLIRAGYHLLLAASALRDIAS